MSKFLVRTLRNLLHSCRQRGGSLLGSPPRLEELEARDVPATFAVDPLGRVRDLDASTSSGEKAVAATQVVFIESSVSGAMSLLRSASAGVDGVLLDSRGDGLSEMRAFLSGRHDLSAIHLLAHGDPAFLQLGTLQLDTATLTSRTADLTALWAVRWRQQERSRCTAVRWPGETAARRSSVRWRRRQEGPYGQRRIV